MAGISTTIELMDRISAPLNRIQTTLYGTTQAFAKADEASNRCFNKFQVEAVSAECMRYEKQIAETEKQLKKANEQIERMQKETAQAQDEAERLRNAFGTITGAIASLGIGYLIKEQVSSAIQYASDLTEVQNVVDVTFGKSAQEINKWSKTTLEAFGLNELTAKQFSGTMGAMLKSSGLTGDAVKEMSMRMTELSGDMASFYNLRAEDAFYKIRAGISGETEPLKQLGINMTVANLEAYALSQGITKSYEKMSQAEQVQLRYNYLMNAGKDAIGDFARTSDSFSNQQKLLNENIKQFTGDLAKGLLPILGKVLKLLNNSIIVLKNNWSIVQPIVIGLTIAVGAYTTALIVHKTSALLSAIAEAKRGSAMMFASGATFKATAMQYGFNGAILACPVTWLVIKIIALIAIIYAVCEAIAKFTKVANSGFGVICGIVASAVAVIYNLIAGLINGILELLYFMVQPIIRIVEWILNVFKGGFDDFGGMVANLIGQIISWFLSLGTVVTKIIDAIFGTDWTAGLNALKSDVQAWGKNDKTITLTKNFEGFNRVNYSDAWKAGTSFGDGISDKIGNIFKGDEENPNDMLNQADALTANTAQIANNTDKLAKKVDISNEILQYMRDVAEQEAINRYTLALDNEKASSIRESTGSQTSVTNQAYQVKIEMTNNNSISNNVDVDSFVSQISNGITEAIQVSAEGVH